MKRCLVWGRPEPSSTGLSRSDASGGSGLPCSRCAHVCAFLRLGEDVSQLDDFGRRDRVA